MKDEEKLMDLLNTLVKSNGLSKREEVFVRDQASAFRSLADRIKKKSEIIADLKDNLHRTYEPDGSSSFLEVGGFEDYHSLQFFHDLASFLDKAFSPTLELLGTLTSMVDKTIGSQEIEEYDNFPVFLEVKDKSKVLRIGVEGIVHILAEGTIPFEQIVKTAYQRAIDQFRYLQKRFLNIGADNTRSYKFPWEKEDHGGFDLNRVPYVKIGLVRDDALLTDLLLDVAQNLPMQHERKERSRGKGKTKTIKYLDPFYVDRAARILIELSEPTYQGYLKNSQEYLMKISRSIRSYYEIISGLQPQLISIIEKQKEDPTCVLQISGVDFRKPMANPTALVSRLGGIDYKSVKPSEEDVRPSSQIERNYFSARKRLLEHLATSIDLVLETESYDEKFKIAKSAVERGVRLKEITEKALETRKKKELKIDKKTENEFYVGTTSGFGQFKFEREPAPKVKMKDVYGKSFDKMKEHIKDLVEYYAKYPNLFTFTAPRGKIKSNMIAIGPYGCGKTEISRAIGADPRFIGAEVTVTDLLTCWFGEFEKNIDRVWDAATELRRNSGDSKLVFLLMDEFDAWFNQSKNSHWVDHTYKRAQKALQIKLDGIVDYPGIITVGFTNEPGGIPLAIYRRFKYVDIVGELEPNERIALLKHFLTVGFPLSRGFTSKHHQKWSEMLDGATGDVIGKVVDDLHYEFMRKFISEHPMEGKKLDTYIRRMERKEENVDKAHVKRTIGQYMRVTPDWLDEKVKSKLAEPIIKEQIDTAKRVYAEARQILANLHKREDVASGCVTQNGPNSQDIKYRHEVN